MADPVANPVSDPESELASALFDAVCVLREPTSCWMPVRPEVIFEQLAGEFDEFSLPFASTVYIAHCAATGLVPAPAAVRASEIELARVTVAAPDATCDVVAMTVMLHTANQLADTAAAGDDHNGTIAGTQSLRSAPVWRCAVRRMKELVESTSDLELSQIRSAAQALIESVKPGGLMFDADGSFRASGVTASQLAAVLIRSACVPHIEDSVAVFPIEHVVEVACAIAQFAYPTQLHLPPIVV
jgi:hypothetical protein